MSKVERSCTTRLLSSYPILMKKLRLLLGLAYIALFSVSVLVADAAKHKQSAARRWFEYAYKIENEAPKRSKQMYVWALAAGLGQQNDKQDDKAKKNAHNNNDLVNTARWRLFYLYKYQNAYLQAADLLLDMSMQVQTATQKKAFAKLEQGFMSILQKAYALHSTNTAQLWQGLQQLNLSREQSSVIPYFTQALIQSSLAQSNGINAKNTQYILMQDILRILCVKHKFEWALKFLQQLRLTTPNLLTSRGYFLQRTAIYIEQEKYEQAERTLAVMRNSNPTANELRAAGAVSSKLPYLQGRIYRGQKRYFRSATSFEKAAQLAQSNSERQRMRFLAAYSLCLAQAHQQAAKLLPPTAPESLSDRYLLWSLLRYETGKWQHKQLRHKLRSHAPYIEAKAQQGNSALAQRIWQLL